MPCSPGKAARLLQAGRAEVYRLAPFTIRLLVATGEAKQAVVVGIDPGFKKVGVSAITNNKEVYRAEVALRTDLVELNSERRMYRRSRRNRKTWYRKPRFLNRRKQEGWLAPSVQHKLESHGKIVQRLLDVLPVTKVKIETASFDLQKIKDPAIEGVGYQQGEQSGFWNVREYVLYRDKHICRQCSGRSKDKRLQVHHLNSRMTGGDRPDNLVTVCVSCHERITQGEITCTAKPGKGFKAETVMNSVCSRLPGLIEMFGVKVGTTYGYITKMRREMLRLPKSHTNDAFVIAGGQTELRSNTVLYQKQVRKCNRKLYKGTRSHLKNTSDRFVCGFQRYDQVRWGNIVGFIYGRRATGYFDIRKLDGTKIHSSAKAKELRLLVSAKTILTEKGDARIAV